MTLAAPGIGILVAILSVVAGVVLLEIATIAYAKMQRERVERHEDAFRDRLIENLIEVVDGDQPFYAAVGRSVSVGSNRFEISPPHGLDGRATREAILSLIATISGKGQERLTDILERSGYVEKTVRDTRSRSAATRSRACAILGAMASLQAIPVLTDRFLHDEDSGVRLTAAEALARIGHPPSADVLLQAIHNRTRWQHLRIANVLSQMGVAAVPTLQRSLLSDDVELVLLALDILSDIGFVDGTDELKSVLSHPHDEVRARAVELLGVIGDVDGIELVFRAAADRASFVRVRAAKALGRLGLPDELERAANYLSVLKQLLVDENWWARQHAAAALAHSGELGQAILMAVASDASLAALQLMQLKEEAG